MHTAVFDRFNCSMHTAIEAIKNRSRGRPGNEARKSLRGIIFFARALVVAMPSGKECGKAKDG